ncbi:energy transducer TonB [Xanthomonas fragariae]|nr:energy transducer TonB [Xanthomonas fragariae]AOD20046.1 energy transducer TonB [Xanthomonas fragariae]
MLIAVPTWWWTRHSDASFVTDTRPLPAASRQILPTADGPRTMTMIPHQPARAPISSEEAKPMPGNPMPSYPPQIARAAIEGSRTARLQLDVQGLVSDVIVDRSGGEDPRLDATVVDSLRQWRFEPATRDGHAVASSSVRVPVDFSSER